MLFTENITSTIIDSQIASANALYNNILYIIRASNSGFLDASRQMGVDVNMIIAALNCTVQKSVRENYNCLDILNNPSLAKFREFFCRVSVNYDKGFYEEARNDLLDAFDSSKIDYIFWFLLGKLCGVSEFRIVSELVKAFEKSSPMVASTGSVTEESYG